MREIPRLFDEYNMSLYVKTILQQSVEQLKEICFMNENLYRPQFNQMKTTEKLVLMEELAARYDMLFLGLHMFNRWGQSCTTGAFEKTDR